MKIAPFHAVLYRQLVAANPAAAQQDSAEHIGRAVCCNGIPAIQPKNQPGLDNAAGVIFWTFSFDTRDETSLLEAIYNEATK